MALNVPWLHRARRVMVRFVLKMMDYTLKMMNFTLKIIRFLLKIRNLINFILLKIRLLDVLGACEGNRDCDGLFQPCTSRCENAANRAF